MHKREVKPALGIAAVALSLTAIGLAGCAGNEVSESSKPAAAAPRAVMAPSVSAPVQRHTTKSTARSKATSKPVSPISNPNNLFSKRTVYVECNTNGRGGREFNLGLGDPRAEAIRKAMLLGGDR
jgi:hypothetical protein